MLSYDRAHVTQLTPFAIALGALYLVACACSALGVAAAGTQRLPLIRAYAYAGPASALLAVAAAFVETVTHFVFKVRARAL